MECTIGADIEVMLEKGGKLVSAIPLLPRNEKGASLPKGIIFYDNVLAEFTIEPAKNKDEFVGNILANLTAAAEMLQKEGVEFRVASSAHYSPEQLDHPDAKRFGCSPDFDAYDVRVNKVSSSADSTTLRTAGAHIHFAHPIFKDPRKTLEMIKMMDLFLGIASIIKDNTPEAIERRTLYGKAGAHRPKRYPGGEYRPLSNFWIKSPVEMAWAYDTTVKCLELIVAGKTVKSLGFNEAEIRRIINEADVKAATAIMAETAKI